MTLPRVGKKASFKLARRIALQILFKIFDAYCECKKYSTAYAYKNLRRFQYFLKYKKCPDFRGVFLVPLKKTIICVKICTLSAH